MRGELEQAKANALKIARTAIRLRHSIEADNEINERLEDLGDAIDKAIRGRKRWRLNPATLEVETEDS